MSNRNPPPIRPRRFIPVESGDEFYTEDTIEEAAVPLLTEFQRQVLEALRTLDRGQQKLFTGQGDLTAAFGALVPRITKLETEAQWAHRIKTAAKILAPFLLGVLAKYIPGINAIGPDILDAIK